MNQHAVLESVRDPAAIESRKAVWIGPLVVVITFLVLTAWSWRKWSDILVDFGKELYIAWQLSSGKVLYTDIAYFNGPFSPYFNALLFRIFGVTTTTLILGNLAILAIATAMIYRLFSQACDRLTATFCCCLFLSVFGLGQLTMGGTYNFIAPYTHEITHGVVLAIGVIFCLAQYASRGTRFYAALGGFLLGLVFLTKAEVFLAAVFTVALGFALLHLVRPPSDRKKLALVFIPAALLPIGLFFVFLAAQMPLPEAMHGIGGTWMAIFQSNVAAIPFYRESAGLDMPLVRLVTMLRAAIAVFLLIGAIIAADLSTRLRSRGRVLALVVSVVCAAVSWLAKRSTDPWSDASGLPAPWLLIGTALPVVTLTAASLLITTLLRKAGSEFKLRIFTLVLWTSFSFALLGKIFLSSRLHHYGFALAMPAALTLAACCVRVIPDALQKFKGGGDVFRRLALAALIADILFFLLVSNRVYGYKHVRFGSGGDAMMVPEPKIDPRGYVVGRALQRVDELIGPEKTFMALPEGASLNYLARRVNPTPHLSFMPPEVAIFGESAMLASMKEHPPDFILLPKRSTSEFHVKPFGTEQSYGKQVMEWIQANYSLVEDIDAASVSTIPFDIKILKRNSR